MRHARLTYPLAWHHVMNRGYEGRPLFTKESHKTSFLQCLEKSVRLYKIRLLAYCIMGNHYHLLLQNTSNKLSDFMRHLNTSWAVRYRLIHGGKGFVFQGRFKSTLIEEESYLETALCYILLNPVRAGIISDPWEFKHSSLKEYGKSGSLTDQEMMIRLFPYKNDLKERLCEWSMQEQELPVIKIRRGYVLGTERFVRKIKMMSEHRSRSQSPNKRRRHDEKVFNVSDLIENFASRKNIDASLIEGGSREGQRIRAGLLAYLREEGAMRYSDIILLPQFRSLKLSALPSIYRNYRKRLRAVDG